jgi:RimJ/RimL family protein N-acetyltransferase
MAIEQERRLIDVRPLHGKLVRLRALEPEDEPLLHEWFNDPEVTSTGGGHGYPISHARERDWIDEASRPGYDACHFGVVALDSDHLIGTVSLRQTSPENRSANLGLAIGEKSRWNQGYATDAMRVACRFGFEQMNLHRIELSTYAEHAAAIRVYEKVGFRIEVRRRDAAFYGGRYCDHVLMGLLEGELIDE